MQLSPTDARLTLQRGDGILHMQLQTRKEKELYKRMKLNEQIAFLRKQKGISQEELARVLGVTNQSVSKWETAQCCPDIELLPTLAAYFHVSVDELLGYEGADTSADLLLQILSTLEALPKGEAHSFALKTAYALHASLFFKEFSTQRAGWDTESVVEHAGRSDWGWSNTNLPAFSTAMRHNSVFFSGNGEQHMSDPWFRRTSALLKVLSDTVCLKTLFAIFNLTIASEESYADISAVAAKSGLPEAKVEAAVEQGLWEFLEEKTEENKRLFRIEGAQQHVVPLLTLFAYYG